MEDESARDGGRCNVSRRDGCLSQLHSHSYMYEYSAYKKHIVVTFVILREITSAKTECTFCNRYAFCRDFDRKSNASETPKTNMIIEVEDDATIFALLQSND